MLLPIAEKNIETFANAAVFFIAYVGLWIVLETVSKV